MLENRSPPLLFPLHIINKSSYWYHNMESPRECKIALCLSFLVRPRRYLRLRTGQVCSTGATPGPLPTTCSPSCDGAPPKTLFSILLSTRKGNELQSCSICFCNSISEMIERYREWKRIVWGEWECGLSADYSLSCILTDREMPYLHIIWK